MDQRKLGEKPEFRNRASFFYDRVKQLRSAPESLPANNSQENSNASPTIYKSHAEKTAEVALGNWKQQIKEYQNLQQSYLERKKQADSLTEADGKKAALQALENLASKLDRMEWELRQGYRRTRSAVREFKAAS